MKFNLGDCVMYKNKEWTIHGVYIDDENEPTYYLKRGAYREIAKESELSQ